MIEGFKDASNNESHGEPGVRIEPSIYISLLQQRDSLLDELGKCSGPEDLERYSESIHKLAAVMIRIVAPHMYQQKKVKRTLFP